MVIQNEVDIPVGDRQAKIAAIIKKREPFRREVEKKLDSLQQRAAAIDKLQSMYEDIMSSGDPLLIEPLATLHLSTLLDKINDQIVALKRLHTRFSRQTLNIGVIGRARQGKSRLLQSLSGLGPNVIPTGSGSHCTGVRSMICHDPSANPHAEVTFYSEKEFFDEVIAPYYQELGLGKSPRNRVEFENARFSAIPPSVAEKAEAEEKYRHLVKDYKERLDDYRSLINTEPRMIDIEEVREYVAQDTVDGERIYSKYLAVKEAKIVCKFDHEDVGQIALIDMPGLGDTGIGAEDRLIKALKEHIDVVLFVIMPSPVGATLFDVEFRLYDTTRNALDGLPIDRWSFVVLNHTKLPVGLSVDRGSTSIDNVTQASSNHLFDAVYAKGSMLGENSSSCEDIRAQIQDKEKLSVGKSIRVVDSLIADCSDPMEAKRAILDIVLNYLVQKMDALDEQYMAAWQARILQLQEEIHLELKNALEALNLKKPGFVEATRTDELFNSVWNNLANSLTGLVSEMDSERSAPNRILKEYFDKKFDDCRDDVTLSDQKWVGTLRNESNSYEMAYGRLLNDMRTRLTYHFVDIDQELRVSMEKVKNDLADVFIQTGILGKVTEGNRGTAFFASMENLLPSSMDRQKRMFKIMAEYELSLRGFFQSRIRHHLNELHSDHTTFELVKKDDDEVLSKLQAAHSKTVERIQKVIETWLDEPSKAAWAIVGEFVDQMLYSENAKNKWRRFYEIYRAVIWPSTFENIENSRRLAEQWEACVSEAIRVNTADSLRFFG